MLSRGFAICSILALTTVVQGGVTIQLVPSFCPGGTCTAGTCSGGSRAGQPCAATCFPTNAVVDVDVSLVQDAGGADQRVRMVELDMADTSSLLNVQLLDTHNRGTPGTGDDIKFWFFGSLNNCVTTPSFCGFNHYNDDDRPAGLVDSRLDMLAIAFQGLNADTQAQLLLPGNGTPVVVGKLRVTVPPIVGIHALNFSNADDTGADRGARVDFGFDPHVIWRARNASPNQVGGGTFNFDVRDPCPPPTVTLASSVPPFTGVGVSSAPTNGTLWRNSRNTIRLTFSGPLPAAPTAGQIQINELLPVPPNPAPGFGSDLSANGFTFTLENGPNGNNSVLRVRDDITNDLLHRKWYAIRNTGGWAGVAAFEAQFPVQVGDFNGDKFVTPQDVSLINGAPGGAQADQSRADINGDGFKTPADVSLANGNQSGFLAKPGGH